MTASLISKPVSRRNFLHLTAGAALSLGLWPGHLRAKDNALGGSFRFVVLNDTHYSTEKCGPWFERVAQSIRSIRPRPDFCFVVGDLAQDGKQEELGPMRDMLRSLRINYHAVLGNHDFTPEHERKAWDQLFPRSINYHFNHRGWQVIGLDSCEGARWRDTRIQPGTLSWVDAKLRKLDRAKPMLLFTHFPLGATTPMRPMNADDLLERFRDFNLVAVFNGHHHGFTERAFGNAVITTNKCCAISRNNHDGTKEKGYFLCEAGNGGVRRQFIEVNPA